MRKHCPSRWLLPLFAWLALTPAFAAATAPAVDSAALPPGVQAPVAAMRVVPGLEEPLVPTGPTSAQEDSALDAAVEAFHKAEGGGDFAERAQPLAAFAAAHPGSAWRLAVLTNLGLGYYHAGYFTKATTAWQEAWASGRAATGLQARALADRAFGELARMHARVGQAEALDALLADAGDRAISGSATELVTGAREGLWMFRNDWGTAYLCGPMALKNLLAALKAAPGTVAALDEVRSGPKGFTLAQVSALAESAGLKHRLVYRARGQQVPVPSVVNWTMNHFAAIVEEADGRYRLKDPTFGGGDLWVSKAAIDSESSGYFLVPAAEQSSLPWRTATADEARRVYGMGNTTNNQPGSTTPCDSKTSTADGVGMCAASATSMVVSLNLNDTPVGYAPQKGPPALVRLTYNQREAYQPAVFSFFNVSPKWTLNVLSYIQDNPTAPGRSVVRYAAGGGAIDYSLSYSYSSATGAFSPERQGQAVLVRIPATGAATSYELRMPDGSTQIFALPDGATALPRRMFMTQIVDPQGNALTLGYDAQRRLTTLTDATGRKTTFDYAAANPLLVTSITDPFGRAAKLAYDQNGRLSSITDVIGIVSSFTYTAAGLVDTLSTPYGTSRFSFGQNTNENSRFLETTDPMGFTERVEFRHRASNISPNDPVAPPGFDNIYLYYRNTFYWDKHVYGLTGADYTKGRITHWLHNPVSQTSPIVESVKMPLERRVWFRYPGQGSTYSEGTSGMPTAIARVLDDGTTQRRSFTYNGLGKPLTAIDPVGRRTVFTYAANQIDLIRVEQQTNTAGGLSTIAAYTYNDQHRPLTATDAAGQTTRYAYNAAGQLTSATNALNETTSYVYDALGRLASIVNANGVTQRSQTYDAFDRVATRTDSEGYTLAYGYDALDRVTLITYPDGTTTRYAYDKLDLASVTDRLGRTTSYTYDANRRLIATTDPLNQVTRYGYHRNGALASLTDAKGNVTSWDIDIQSRPTAKRYANGNVETYAYEATTSRPKSITDPMGQVKSFGYTQDDRVNALRYASQTRPTPSVAFTFDPFFPRPTAMADGIGTTTFQYHPPGAAGALQLALEDGPYSNDTVAYQYDALGRVATRTVDTSAETFAYDTLGRTIAHNSALGAFTRSYLGQTGQLTSQISSTGVGTSWSYEGNGNDRRLRGITNSGQARSFGFTTDPENRLVGATESIAGVAQRSWSYSYDSLDRLTRAQPSSGAIYSYSYDAADNLISINGNTAAYNAANQIADLSGTPFLYDANGNLLDDGVRTFQWDAEDRMVGIRYKSQAGNATALRYDGMGRRLAIADTGPTGITEVRHLWCGEVLCQGRTSTDQITRRFYSEGMVIPPSGTQIYYGVDQIGSVRDLLTTPNGSRVASFDYDPYGNPTSVAGRISTEFKYGGLYLHGQSGLYFANYRAYNPRTAQWLSRDPISEEGGHNLYGYVSGNPITRTDTTGEITPIDSAVEGVVSVVIGKAVAWALGEDYSRCDAAYDFFTGALTSGLSNIGKLRKLGRVAGEGAEAISKTAPKATRGWTVGDDVYKATSKGTEPAWSTVRSRFWKNEANQSGAAEKYGEENVKRMLEGKAPQRFNADKGGMESMELSHEPIPRREGGKEFVPRWPQDHAKVDPFRRPGY